MKLNHEEILKRAGEIQHEWLRDDPRMAFRAPETIPTQIDSTQVKALCQAICEALNKPVKKRNRL